MRIRFGAATALTIAATMFGALAGPAPTAAAADNATTWTADLDAAEASGVEIAGGRVTLSGAGAFAAPATGGAEGASGPLVATGLLTFPARDLPVRTDRVQARIDGTTSGATVDVRAGRGAGWTEWLPADPSGTVVLPTPTDRVQARLVLTGADAVVDGVILSAQPAAPGSTAEGDTEAVPLTFRVFATREGLVGGTTANGHVIAERDHFVALPSRRALSPRGSSDYTVRVCVPGGRCAYAPVWDVGPWNTRDDYWNPPGTRQEWTDLPHGVPQAQAAHADGYNGGNDQFGRKAKNPAGIDLGDGVFWDALGLKDNAWVDVEYLWTGSADLRTVAADTVTDVLGSPDAAAAVVGTVAAAASLPAQCRVTGPGGEFLQLGAGQFLPAAAVPDAGTVPACPAG